MSERVVDHVPERLLEPQAVRDDDSSRVAVHAERALLRVGSRLEACGDGLEQIVNVHRFEAKR